MSESYLSRECSDCDSDSHSQSFSSDSSRCSCSCSSSSDYEHKSKCKRCFNDREHCICNKKRKCKKCYEEKKKYFCVEKFQDKKCKKLKKWKDGKNDKVFFEREFHIKLTPEQEVVANRKQTPEVKTTGKFWISFSKGLDIAFFKLCISKGKKITQAHIHFGRAGKNGAVVAFLFNVAPVRGPGGVDVCGCIEGCLTNKDIVGSTSVKNIASLLDALRQGNLYVNVHSEKFPDGVIRGQLFGNTTS